MGERLTDLQDQLQDLINRQRAGADVLSDGLARHVLHGDVRAPGAIHPGVIEARDVLVLQRGQDVALARHARRHIVDPDHARQLDRHGA